MKIIFDKSVVNELANRHLILELDTMVIGNQTKTIYCLLDDISIDQLSCLDQFRDHHNEFLDLYKKQKYPQCPAALKKLMDYGIRDINSYYEIMLERIEKIISMMTPDK
jgi:hypothetical protein